jgi:hypothetical protein
MVQSFGQVTPWGILPSQPALLFWLIGEVVKAGPFEGKRFLGEGGKTGYLPQGGGVVRTLIIITAVRVFIFFVFRFYYHRVFPWGLS